MKVLLTPLFLFPFLLFAQNEPQITNKPRLPELAPLYFTENSSDLFQDHLEELDVIAKHLEQHPDVGLVIIGHTDDIGSQHANQHIALLRAHKVMEYLLSKGVEQSRITIGGQGEDNPVFNDTTDTARAYNRRVNLYFRYRDKTED